jgi:hypothetical protein
MRGINKLGMGLYIYQVQRAIDWLYTLPFLLSALFIFESGCSTASTPNKTPKDHASASETLPPHRFLDAQQFSILVTGQF